MSYDVTFKVKVEGVDYWLAIDDICQNITFNLGEMIRKSTGLEWNDGDNGLCTDVMPKIVDGYNQLTMHPERYVQYESPNGWGTISGCRNFFQRIMDDWNGLLRDREEIAGVAHFWIYC